MTIQRANGTSVTVNPPGADTGQFSVALLSDNMTGFGDHVNQNFIQVTENFAHDRPPSNPTKGQLWFDTSAIETGRNGSLRVYREFGADNIRPVHVISENDFDGNTGIEYDNSSGMKKVKLVQDIRERAKPKFDGLHVGSGTPDNMESGDLTAEGNVKMGADGKTIELTGDINIKGTLNSVSMNNMEVNNTSIKDQTITLNAGITGSFTEANIEVERVGNNYNARIRWLENDTKWQVRNVAAANEYYDILTSNDTSTTAVNNKIPKYNADRKLVGDITGKAVNVVDSAITATQLATDAVTEIKIQDGAVTRDKLGANAVTTVKINNGAINGNKVDPNSNFSLGTLKVAGSVRMPILDVLFDDGLTLRGQAAAESPNYDSKMKIDAQGRIFIGTSLSTSSADIANNQGISIKPSGTTWGHNHSITSPEIYFTGERVVNNGRISWNDVIIRANPPTNGGNIIVSRKNDGNLISFRNTGQGVNTAYDAHISIDDGTVTYATTSDKRLKKNITTITDGLNTINALRPVKFNFKSQKNGAAKLHGLIAQEVEKVNPKFVVAPSSNEPDDFYNIDYSRFVPDLIAAVQELSAEVETLKAELKSKK